jgi:hypothetical protein
MEEQLILLAVGLANAVGLLAKVIYDARQNKRNGNPNGWKKAVDQLRTELKEEIRRFSDRVDIRDRDAIERCSMCHQRLAKVETQVEERLK